MIKTVLFDLGNVILPFDLMRLAVRLAEFSPFSPEKILKGIAYGQVAHDFETGRMTPTQFYNHIIQGCQISGLTFETFVPIFNDIFDQDEKMVELISQLKPKYNLGLISNANEIHVSYLRITYPVLKHFNEHWFSNEAGLRKPDPAIYNLALRHFGTKPHESVFIDDVLENVESAKNLGIRALHYTGLSELMTELKKVGVEY